MESGGKTDGIALSQTDLFRVIDNHVKSEEDILWLTASGIEGLLDLEPDNVGVLEGGVEFGHFAGKSSMVLNKVPENAVCSVDMDAGRNKNKKFVNCVRDILDNCAEGAIIIREGDVINAYSNC